MLDLSGLTTAQLLEEHNRFADDGSKLSRWVGEKDQLVSLVTKLRDDERRTNHPLRRTIKVAAYELLQKTDYTDPENRSVGFSYDYIENALGQEFPNGRTTNKCLRWYAVQLNLDGVKLPYRPRRAPPKKPKKETVQ